MSDLVDDIKVEVQLPADVGDNLLTNTSGQYGAWQWSLANDGVTDVSITGDDVARTITATRGATAGSTAIWTDFLPVTPGFYANARVDLTAITTGHKVTLGLQFYDSAYDVLTWHYSSPATTLDTLGFSSVSVPGSASWVRLLVILDKTADPSPDTGSANAGAGVTFTRAMVTELTTTGTPSIVVTNVMPNGSFDYGTTGWEAGSNIGSISTTSSGGETWLRGYFNDGVVLSPAEYSYVRGPYLEGIEAGENYSLRLTTNFPSGLTEHSFTTGVLYRWYDDISQIGSDVHLTDGSTDTTIWHRVWKIITAPAGATRLRVFPFARHSGQNLTLSDAWYFSVESVCIVKSSVLMPYFDGDSADTSSHVYAWTGTAGNSPSTRTSVGAVDYVEPDEQFLEITGGYNQFDIERPELDLSTMSGVIVDPALSPARADAVVTPGRGVRVWAYRPETDAFERLFTGKLGPCTVEYDPLEDAKRQKVKISVSAVGRESTLAQASRPGVALTAAGLPALALSQAGVPWVVDGSTGMTPAESVAENDQATALDQVALTRDTVAGTAWIDPDGTLRFHTTLGAKSTGPATMGPADYSAAGLKIGFSTDDLINSVNVTRLIRASDGSTEERVDGQTYEDGTSVRKWGRHSFPLTIASIPGATIDAKNAADRILAANGTPEIAIAEVAINSADERTHAFHDLYDLITVTAETIDGIVMKALRVARIKHEFTTERRPGGQGRWRTTYGFKIDGVVATPSIQPPLSSTASDGWVVFEKTSPSASMVNITLEYRLTNGLIEWRTSGSTAVAWTVPPSGNSPNQNITTSVPSGLRPSGGNWTWTVSLGSAGHLAVTAGGNVVMYANEATGSNYDIPVGTSLEGQSPAFVLP